MHWGAIWSMTGHSLLEGTYESLHEKKALRVKNAFLVENQESVKKGRLKKGSTRTGIRRVPVPFTAAIFCRSTFSTRKNFSPEGLFSHATTHIM